MAVRSTMAALIASVRTMINDPAGASQVFQDQDIQDVMDESRVDYRNEPLKAVPTFVSGSIQYLDYYHELGGWEDGFVLKEFLTNVVTPSASEPIMGHWSFAANTWPSVYITGSLHDRYRAAADLLERWAARWAFAYNVNVDGQSLHREGASTQLLNLAAKYRLKQRVGTLTFRRGDLYSPGEHRVEGPLGPLEIDYMSSGDKS